MINFCDFEVFFSNHMTNLLFSREFNILWNCFLVGLFDEKRFCISNCRLKSKGSCMLIFFLKWNPNFFCIFGGFSTRCHCLKNQNGRFYLTQIRFLEPLRFMRKSWKKFYLLNPLANFWDISETVLLENSSIKKSWVPIQFF